MRIGRSMLFGGTLFGEAQPGETGTQDAKPKKRKKKKKKKNFLVQVLSLRSIRRKHKFIQRRDLGEF